MTTSEQLHVCEDKSEMGHSTQVCNQVKGGTSEMVTSVQLGVVEMFNHVRGEKSEMTNSLRVPGDQHKAIVMGMVNVMGEKSDQVCVQQKDLGKTDVDGEKSDPASRLVPSAMEEGGKSVMMNVVGREE